MQEIEGIIERMKSDTAWGSREDKDRAFEIARELGHKNLKQNCPPCHHQVRDALRAEIGLDPLGKQVSPQSREQRLKICRECEHLNITKTNCMKCGCFIHVKASFQRFHCPIEKW